METKTITIEKDNIEEKLPKKYKVLMYNDDFTTMEFVVAILIEIFNKTIDEANNIMIEVHNRGIGIAGIYPFDIAMSKLNKAQDLAVGEGFPFKLTIEEE
ncbi:ATP-dependent Clp protease adaptor ClpS [Clostridium sp.]|uniref:ATP-dependent Clp protease adaptor ClpS n=1 Tax=Clostridium sp. TaxID=1506 RepID=UPI002619397D|nr:ATP-dependent Clp protease adaptor ClpS [Clostridium sp.]